MRSLIGLFLFVLVSTGATAASTEKELLGRWLMEEPSGLECTVEFAPDGTFHGNAAKQNKTLWEFAGKWSLKDDIIYYTYTKSNLSKIPPGYKEQDHLLEVTKDYFDVESAKGGKKRYQKVTVP
jgi:hypothetical protein